jgi:hypothetical protein
MVKVMLSCLPAGTTSLAVAASIARGFAAADARPVVVYVEAPSAQSPSSAPGGAPRRARACLDCRLAEDDERATTAGDDGSAATVGRAAFFVAQLGAALVGAFGAGLFSGFSGPLPPCSR